MRFRNVFVFSTVLFAGACASGDDDDTSATATLQAPMLMEVEPMEGALHLAWINRQKDCDSVEAERKMEHQTSYDLAFSVPGSVDNEMDTAATDNMMFTYRMRCKKGATYSSYSHEVSANPHDM